MKRIEWWAGVTLIAAVLIFHAAFPRFEWRPIPDNGMIWVRVDRWTGRASLQNFRRGHDLPMMYGGSVSPEIQTATPDTIRVPLDQLPDPK